MSVVYNVDTDSKWLFVKSMTEKWPDIISYSFKLFLVVIRYAYHVNIQTRLRRKTSIGTGRTKQCFQRTLQC